MPAIIGQSQIQLCHKKEGEVHRKRHLKNEAQVSIPVCARSDQRSSPKKLIIGQNNVSWDPATSEATLSKTECLISITVAALSAEG